MVTYSPTFYFLQKCTEFLEPRNFVLYKFDNFTDVTIKVDPWHDLHFFLLMASVEFLLTSVHELSVVGRHLGALIDVECFFVFKIRLKNKLRTVRFCMLPHCIGVFHCVCGELFGLIVPFYMI